MRRHKVLYYFVLDFYASFIFYIFYLPIYLYFSLCFCCPVFLLFPKLFPLSSLSFPNPFALVLCQFSFFSWEFSFSLWNTMSWEAEPQTPLLTWPPSFYFCLAGELLFVRSWPSKLVSCSSFCLVPAIASNTSKSTLEQRQKNEKMAGLLPHRCAIFVGVSRLTTKHVDVGRPLLLVLGHDAVAEEYNFSFNLWLPKLPPLNTLFSLHSNFPFLVSPQAAIKYNAVLPLMLRIAIHFGCDASKRVRN